MNSYTIRAAILCIMFCGSLFVHAQEMDKELSDLATKLATLTKDNGKKKVSVLDFTDLNGAESELGKYIAEELTVNLVMVKKDFSVLDRANLRKILAEHKLTATGLVDPENAKKLGQFAGVDALILGTIIPKSQKITLTAKIITTDTAEIVGAAKAEFKEDDTAQKLLSRTATETKVGDSSSDSKEDRAKVVKTFGDLRVELQSLKIVNHNEYLLTMTLTNQNSKKSIWVALNETPGGYGAKGHITDSSGYECPIVNDGLSGIEHAAQFVDYGNQSPVFINAPRVQSIHHRFQPSLEIKPSDSSIATVKFNSTAGKQPEPGLCTLQLEILLGHDFIPGGGVVSVQNLVTKLAAE